MSLFNKFTNFFLTVFVVYGVWLYTHINEVDQGNEELQGTENYPTETEWAFSDFKGKYFNGTKYIKEITHEIFLQNQVQYVRNMDTFGPINAKTSVLVIQVHKRLKYLRNLIQSLSKVWHINNSLLIFSHDLYLPQMNNVIHNISFARVLQIFYPHSIQLNPSNFPGQSVDDCPHNISQEKAQAMRCRNADHPDLFGLYRRASWTQTKHHWWWKAHFVFDRVTVLDNYTSVIAFLEEDHYVAPDFLWVLRQLETAMVQNSCHGCDILSPGSYLDTWKKSKSYLQMVITTWTSTRHNMGLSFNRSLWNNIKRCSHFFCEFDEYNWDWTLLRMSQVCLDTPLIVLYPHVPRIFHTGDCGMHFSRNVCDPTPKVIKIEAKLKAHVTNLFPDNHRIKRVNKTKRPIMPRCGGWGDVRDHKLCLSFSMKNNFQNI